MLMKWAYRISAISLGVAPVTIFLYGMWLLCRAFLFDQFVYLTGINHLRPSILGSIEPCGCFGEQLHFSPMGAFYKSLVLWLLSVSLILHVYIRPCLRKNGIFHLAILLLILTGCDDRRRRITSELRQLERSRISLPLDSMVRYESCYPSAAVNMGGIYRLVVYVDSTECTPCALNNIYRWYPVLDSLIAYPLYRETLFIYSPSRSKISDIKKQLSSQRVNYPVYLDTCDIFSKSNRHIPSNRLMHIFLLDDKDSVVVVGNPQINVQIREMIFDIVRDL